MKIKEEECLLQIHIEMCRYWFRPTYYNDNNDTLPITHTLIHIFFFLLKTRFSYYFFVLLQFMHPCKMVNRRDGMVQLQFSLWWSFNGIISIVLVVVKLEDQVLCLFVWYSFLILLNAFIMLCFFARFHLLLFDFIVFEIKLWIFGSAHLH